VLQTSPIHEGITDQPADALERLYRTYVTDGLDRLHWLVGDTPEDA
jgi:hypothetical protein